MSKLVHAFEYQAGDVPHVDTYFGRHALGVTRAAFLGVLAEPDTYLPQPRTDWSKSHTQLVFNDLDQLDAVIEGLERFRQAWVAEQMQHATGQLALAAD